MKYFAYCRKSSEGEERQALSIPAQIEEIRRSFADLADVEIVAWFEEKMSAKAPGRPVYAEMIRRIEKGEADAIVAWHPDRLARNSVDGGWIIHLLDSRVLKTLKFVSYTYEQSPEGMFMLQIMFGQSKYYVDNLSVNVKRGLRQRRDMGWLPNRAPAGYRNDRETGTIVIDPDRFALLRRAWDMLLTGIYTVPQIHDRLNNEWGFRTHRRKKTGGGPLGLSALYKLFSNPFYAGVLNWSGEWRPGKHKPMVTLEEFQRAQQVLGRSGKPKPATHSFAFTGGLIRCRCGLSVTAEEKTKPSGRRYVYYHCTRRVRSCREPAVRLERLEAMIADFLRGIQLAGPVEWLLIDKLNETAEERKALKALASASRAEALAKTQRELQTLTDMRVRELIDDAEYLQRRNVLQQDAFRLKEASAHDAEGDDRLELGRSVILFRKYAADWFLSAPAEDKRLILKTVGSNCVLGDRKLSIQARFPFRPASKSADCLHQCGEGYDVRTPGDKIEAREIIEAVHWLKKYGLASEDCEERDAA
ncbi:MAG: recombinase family protein [Alphaproteobacteria bacterium]|nr:recombinase family protein [Alphaproteobacteria bacterium]